MADADTILPGRRTGPGARCLIGTRSRPARHSAAQGPARALVIGDSLTTDIAGAEAAGLDSLFVTGGIHAEALAVEEGEEPEPARLAALYAEFGRLPTG